MPLLEHPVVEGREDSGPDGISPADRLRAAVRPGRQRRAAARRSAVGREHPRLVAEEAARLQKRLGAGDRMRLNEYLDSVREVEQRIARTEEHNATVVELPERPTGVPADWEEHAKLMFDLQVLAFQTDITRVFTLMMGRELSGHVFKNLGHVRTAPHHHAPPPRQKLIEQKVADRHLSHAGAEVFARQAAGDARRRRLAARPLDDRLRLGMGDGNQHAFHDIPTLVLGKGAGRMNPAVTSSSQDVPMTNLLLSLLDKVGVQVEKLGDSTGRLELDRLPRDDWQR